MFFKKSKKVKVTKTKVQPKRKIAPKKQATVPVVVKKHRDKNGNHNHVILDSIGKMNVSVGLTKQPKKGKNGSNNYPLKKDTLDVGQKGYKPKEKTYMRRQGTVDDQKNYFHPQKGSMVEEDYQKAVKYGNHAKEKYLQNKKGNGSAKRVNNSPSAKGK